jgi:hypothetical protein
MALKGKAASAKIIFQKHLTFLLKRYKKNFFTAYRKNQENFRKSLRRSYKPIISFTGIIVTPSTLFVNTNTVKNQQKPYKILIKTSPFVSITFRYQ